MHILSVAEKPSVAKELARIISNGQNTSENGFSPYNRIFRIHQCDFKVGQRASMAVTSVTGHLMEMDFAASHKGWQSCAPQELFGAPVERKVSEKNENIEKTLQQEARKANVLLLWLDCDMEGENICFEVIEVCKKANPRLDIYRARFSALIDRDIFRTMKVCARIKGTWPPPLLDLTHPYLRL